MRYEEAIELILPHLKKIKEVKSVFLKGSIARGENDQYSDLDLYIMLNKDVEIKSIYSEIIKSLEQYRQLIFYELIEIICPQIVGVFNNMLHIDCYMVHEDNYPQTDDIKILYDPEEVLKNYEKKDLILTKEQFTDYALDSCWFIYQYDHIVGRGQNLWTTEMIDNALSKATNVLLYHYYPEKSALGKKAANHLPHHIYKKLIAINDLNNSKEHKKAVQMYMNLYKDYILEIVKEEWIEGFENIYFYLIEKYAY